MPDHASGNAFGTPGVISLRSNKLPANAAMSLTNQQNSHPSHLFTLRVWAEPLGHGQTELRCEVRHVLSGETRYFREWSALLEYLFAKLDTGSGE